MLQQKPQLPKESTWAIIRFFYLMYNQLNSIYIWLFPERFMVYENNESGLLMQRYMEDKDFFAQLSSGWVGLHFVYKGLITLGVSLSFGVIGITLGAPTICALFALVVMIGIHTPLVAHEQHRRNLAQSMSAEACQVQKNLEEQHQLFAQAQERFFEVASELDVHLDGMSNGVEELQHEVFEIKQKKEEYLETIEQVDVLAEEILEKQSQLTVQIDSHIDGMKQFAQTLDNEADTFRQFAQTLNVFETCVNTMVDTEKKYAQSVAQFSIFVTNQSEKRTDGETLDYDIKLKQLSVMLDEANNHMDNLNSGLRFGG